MNAVVSESSVPLLLGAVARRLWLARTLESLRLASWATAAILLTAATAHVIAGPASITGLRTALLLLWGTVAAWSLARRPRPAECALWADRNLGGESAYSTWLEFRHSTPRPAQAPALQRLEKWSEVVVPRSMRMLAGRREPTGLVRPLTTTAICAAIAVIVLQLPTANRRSVAEPLAQSPASGEPPRDVSPPRGPELDDGALADELATALRSTTAGRDPMDRRAGPASATPDGAYDDGREAVAAGGQELPGAVRTDGMAQLATVGVGTPGSMPGSTEYGTGSGRDAGDSRDERKDRGVSRPLPASAVASPADDIGLPSTADRQANMDQRATYDAGLAAPTSSTYVAGVPALPATPPPAAYMGRLTPAQSAYVRAWRETTEARP